MPSVSEIKEFFETEQIEYNYQGAQDITVDGFSSLKKYRVGTLTWAKTEDNYLADGQNRLLTLLIAQEGIPAAGNVFFCKQSKRAFFSALQHFWGESNKCGVERKDSCIETGAQIAANAQIGYGCYICAKAVIEDGVVLGNNVSIEGRVHIGAGTHIGSNTVIGSSGFGIYRDSEGHNHRARHYGGVWIGQGVDIGDNCVINRGTIDDTVIGNYVAIDSLRIIPHNVEIGDNCTIIGGICGSCVIGEDSYIAPGAIVKNQVKVGAHCMVNLNVLLTDDLPDGYIAHKDRRLCLDYHRIL